MRRVDRPSGTRVTDQEQKEEAPAAREGATTDGTAEQVVRIPEADQESPSPAQRSGDGASSPPAASSDARAAGAAAGSVATAPPEAPTQEAPPAERGAPPGEASPTAPTTRIPKVERGEPAPKRRPRFSPSRLVVGALLLLGGIAWLLDVTNTTSVNWGVLLSVALLGAGGGLILLGLRGGGNRGLVVLGVLLAAILTAAATLRIDIAGGIGSQTVHPVSTKALGETYRMAVGQMTIDLRHVSFGNGSPKLRATVGVGQLVVLIPPGANMRVHARAGAGMVSAFAKTQSGLDVDHTFFRGSGSPAVILDLSVGVGQVTVHK